MATSWKCFEDQNFLTFYLIQPLSRSGVKEGGLVGLRRGSRQKGLVFINLRDEKIGWQIFFFFFFFIFLLILVYKIGLSIVNNSEKKKKFYQKEKEKILEFKCLNLNAIKCFSMKQGVHFTE